ncbi:B-cell receptor CD22-like isoform X4 [Silurus meridionalis]|uniref:B-cell receptor CD22-like isoform X4 n=1 Tax=Silurus meridionalis TaxID=175797 RepID=UPI001EECEB33|nr:B-cell receptor CD22-like isoform X4 [Silurus meridionalis]
MRPKNIGIMDDEFRMLLLLSFLLYIKVSVSGIQHVHMSCSKKEICALNELSVNLTCSYSNINITTGFWFNLKDKAKWWKEEHPEDLTLDSDYAGRVRYTEMTNSNSTLTITDLRERDSGEYHLMFITDKGEKYQSSAGVTLTVTDLQVTHNFTEQTLTCRTSCPLTSHITPYYWYRNGQMLKTYTETFSLKNADDGSYSCSADYYKCYSPTLCVERNCWDVNYTDKRVCAMEGSSVEFAGNYSHPSNLRVNKVFWHYFEQGKSIDLKTITHVANRVKYRNNNLTLKINQLTKNDSGEYRLRFITNDGKGFSGRPGVILKVIDLQVRVRESAVDSEGQTTVMLSCITSCTLSNNPTYMWYKNRQPITNKPTKHNKLYLSSSEDAGNYSCALRGCKELRSPEETVTIKPGSEDHTVLKHIIVGLTAFLVVTLLSGALCMWKRKSSSANGHSSSGENEQTCSR